MRIHGIEIKPGMVLYGSRKGMYITLVAIPYGANTIAFANLTEGGWSLYYETTIDNLEEIRNHPKNGSVMGGEILWKKPEEFILTIENIRKKFKIPGNVKIIIK